MKKYKSDKELTVSDIKLLYEIREAYGWSEAKILSRALSRDMQIRYTEKYAIPYLLKSDYRQLMVHYNSRRRVR